MNGFLAASVFIIVCMTIDRYVAICRPARYLQRRGGRGGLAAVFDILLAFYAGLILQVPRFYGDYTVVTSACIDGSGMRGEEEEEDENADESEQGPGVNGTEEPPCICGVEGTVRFMLLYKQIVTFIYFN